MFTIAVIVGLFANLLLLLGTFGLLTPTIVIVVTGVFLFILAKLFSPHLIFLYHHRHFYQKELVSHPLQYLLVVIIAFAVLTAFVATLGPEIQFDALWYHLTLPQMYLKLHETRIITTPPFFYSAMPQLIEMLYLPALLVANEIAAKIIHAGFALATSLLIFYFTKKHFTRQTALIAVVIFLTDLSIIWLMGTAGIDLGRTFFETTALFLLLTWIRRPKNTYLSQSGVLMGFALSTKYLSFASFAAQLVLILMYSKKKLADLLTFFIPAVAVSFIWYLRPLVSTGNPLFPLFTPLLGDTAAHLVYPSFSYLIDLISLSWPSFWDSPISPLYLIFSPFICLYLVKNSKLHPLALYTLLGIIGWLFIPRTGGTRFFVPYLPALAILTAATLSALKPERLRRLATGLVIGVAMVNLTFSLKLNTKFIRYHLGFITKHEFLTQYLNQESTFYDGDRYFADTIKPTDHVLVIGGHNLFYLNFPYTHISYYQNQPYNYILTLNQDIPDPFKDTIVSYHHPQRGVTLYRLGGFYTRLPNVL